MEDAAIVNKEKCKKIWESFYASGLCLRCIRKLVNAALLRIKSSAEMRKE